MLDNEILTQVFKLLQEREIHPSGTFDNGGRFYATHSDLINVRYPSRKWPYSHMTACRTLKYVKAINEKFNPKTKDELIKLL